MNLDNNIRICIERSQAKEYIGMWTDFTKFGYTITDDTEFIQDRKETLWKVKGRLERVLSEDRTSNTISSPCVILFDLGGLFALTAIKYKIGVEYKNNKTIEIDNVDFHDYGRIFEFENLDKEEIYFVGTMNYKNIAK